MTTSSQDHMAAWTENESLAEALIPLIGKLYRENNVVLSLYGRRLVNLSVIGLLKAHRFVRQIEENELPVQETFPIIEALSNLNLGAASIDVAKLNVKFRKSGKDLDAFLQEELAEIIGKGGEGAVEPTDVVLYGFGRIGRLLARILIDHSRGGSSNLRLRAIVVRKGADNDLQKRASLLRRDSIHGPFDGSIKIDEENNALIANGNFIKIIYSNDPSTIDYTEYGIKDAIVVDNTGIWRDEEGLGQHLKSKGVARVLLTAPGKGDLKNIVYGVNDQDITEADKIISAASCTTNAITPVLKVLNETYGVDHGHVETVHSYTNDQNLIDNFHKGSRRGRAAGLNMVLTETGAAKAVAKALPELKGKLSGNAIRVPTPNVSMAILNLELEKATSKEELNDRLRKISLNSSLQRQIDYTDSQEVVSSDFVGSDRAGVVDGLATLVNNEGKNVILYVWYDNEYGYSHQVIRCVEDMAGNSRKVFPAGE